MPSTAANSAPSVSANAIGNLIAINSNVCLVALYVRISGSGVLVSLRLSSAYIISEQGCPQKSLSSAPLVPSFQGTDARTRRLLKKSDFSMMNETYGSRVTAGLHVRKSHVDTRRVAEPCWPVVSVLFRSVLLSSTAQPASTSTHQERFPSSVP